jgi:hypothetical protein
MEDEEDAGFSKFSHAAASGISSKKPRILRPWPPLDRFTPPILYDFKQMEPSRAPAVLWFFRR